MGTTKKTGRLRFVSHDQTPAANADIKKEGDEVEPKVKFEEIYYANGVLVVKREFVENATGSKLKFEVIMYKDGALVVDREFC
jgi:hypothetical protein